MGNKEPDSIVNIVSVTPLSLFSCIHCAPHMDTQNSQTQVHTSAFTKSLHNPIKSPNFHLLQPSLLQLLSTLLHLEFPYVSDNLSLKLYRYGDCLETQENS